MAEKKGPAACDSRALKAEFNNQSARYSASAFQSQVSPAEARWPRITARELNNLRDIENRIAILGRYVRLGCADRNMVAGRIRAALARAGLDREAQQ